MKEITAEEIEFVRKAVKEITTWKNFNQRFPELKDAEVFVSRYEGWVIGVGRNVNLDPVKYVSIVWKKNEGEVAMLNEKLSKELFYLAYPNLGIPEDLGTN